MLVGLLTLTLRFSTRGSVLVTTRKLCRLEMNVVASPIAIRRIVYVVETSKPVNVCSVCVTRSLLIGVPVALLPEYTPTS